MNGELDWLRGPVLPDHWSAVPVKRVGSVVLGKMLQAENRGSDTLSPYLRAANVQPDGVLATDDVKKMWFSKPETSQLTVRKGDVVVVEGGIGGYGRAAFVSDDRLAEWGFQNSINRIRPMHDHDGRFLAYSLIAIRALGYLRVYCNIVSMPHLTAEKLASLPVPLAPPDEQRAIADYLDHEAAQIDALVAKQGEFIGLLRERRRMVVPSILSKAALAGNRPDKLHRRTRMGNGSTPRSGEDRYWRDGDIPWVNSSVVNSPAVHEPSKFVTQAAVSECHLPLVKPGSLLVALTGEGKTRGAATILRISSTINQHLAFIEPDERYWVPEYLLWLMRSNYERLRRISSENGATKGGLTVGDLRALKVPMPDLDEQRRLVKELEEATSRIDALIAKAQEHISLATERRSALITAAVTGQIDVRAARKAG